MSNPIESVNTIKVYENNDEDLEDINIIIKNHWNKKQFVVLEIKGKKYTVVFQRSL